MIGVWVNPVARARYGYENVKSELEKKQCLCLDSETDWGAVVLDKYRSLTARANGKTVVDARCPKAYRMIEQRFADSSLEFAGIPPILIHYAIAISRDSRFTEMKKIITTPCRVLAEEGNRLCLPNTCFQPWNQFAKEWKLELCPMKLDASPIPPGFFETIPGKIDSISGESHMLHYFETKAYRKTRLVEMLYCENGCHRGDGV